MKKNKKTLDLFALEERAREAARSLAVKLPAPVEPDGLWYKDLYGQMRATPAQLERVALQTLAVSDIVDFIKYRVGRRRWPRRESEMLLQVFETLLRIEDQVERIRAARKIASAVAAEYLYAAASAHHQNGAA